MATLLEHLLRAGYLPPDRGPEPVAVEFARIARVLRERGCRTIGLVPCADDVAVPPVALRLAHALAAISHCDAGVVDAAGTWLEPADVQVPAGKFASEALAPGVVVLTRSRAAPGRSGWDLQRCLTLAPWSTSHVVVDLTGLERSGEHLEAIAMLDGAAVVARAGRSRAAQVRRALYEIARTKRVGVILAGARAGVTPGRP
jgi:hypothetical protein